MSSESDVAESERVGCIADGEKHARLVADMARRFMGSKASYSSALGSPYSSGRSRHWLKSKNPKHPAVKSEAKEE